jgi:hypothetical protein
MMVFYLARRLMWQDFHRLLDLFFAMKKIGADIVQDLGA